jgi:hypothetical protein
MTSFILKMRKRLADHSKFNFEHARQKKNKFTIDDSQCVCRVVIHHSSFPCVTLQLRYQKNNIVHNLELIIEFFSLGD